MGMHFTKMHGLGNDFIVLDGVNQTIQLEPTKIVGLSNRHTGIGFDQCLIIEPGATPEIDFSYRIINANGQEVGQCGNGARCLALFAYHYGLTNKKKITVATSTTKMDLTINEDGTVTVNMGVPKLTPAEIPFLAITQQAQYDLQLHNGQHISLHTVNVGNPHAVTLVTRMEHALVHQLGAEISTHPSFPEQVNVGFMRLIDSEHIELRVYERGCGETNACGSGAVAAAAVGRLYYHLKQRVKVSLLGGDLIVDWPNTEEAIYLSGSATFVYEGQLW